MTDPIVTGRPADTAQGQLWGEALPDEAAERSRATMWDVVRFSEHHRYAAVIVENVVEVAQWLPFRAWPRHRGCSTHCAKQAQTTRAVLDGFLPRRAAP